MKLLSPTESKRWNEVAGFVFLAFGLLVLFSLVSYRTSDPSWNTAVGNMPPQNLAGYVGAYMADFLWQTFGIGALLLPLCSFLLGWKWIRSEAIDSPGVKLAGFLMLGFSLCAGLGEGPELHVFGLPASGVIGMLLAQSLISALNRAGAVIVTITGAIVSIYLVSTFTLSKLPDWFGGPLALFGLAVEHLKDWFEERQKRKWEKRREKERLKAEARAAAREQARAARRPIGAPAAETNAQEPAQPRLEFTSEINSIPICTLESETQPPQPKQTAAAKADPRPVSNNFRLPSTDLLNESQGRSAYDEQELKDIAVRVKSKFEEFNVLGSVVQINPGPVVTTFEFKPEAGIKYSRITTLSEDLCLGLQAESILIERIPGKPTVGIEVPNTRRELISLREILESEEFSSSTSRLTISMGKDINGRIKVAALDSMPHLLIAGSTGSGKSVMINSMIMSVLYKSTPDDVRMILVDPKRLELGLYEGIPHLLTPVITDPRKATNALRNAVLEMERRLRILAEQGVRNIEQYNKKIRKMQQEPRNLFDEEAPAEELRPLPYILILIDELADLMMIEGRNVEESVTRLAQMARAVGMHLVLATQRPSVDVITGLIKANFPARISFRVATRVDSRTILDVMGSEHLLGKGDMLFLPPGSSRLTRVHGAFVTESEINRVVDFWKQQATPEYDQSLLLAPPPEDESAAEDEGPSGEQDPMYEEALRVVLEMGKASTSTLQRRLRLGYGRAARILDMMHRDGIIGPPDGSKPREVLKRPEWMHEVEENLR
ncbi:MAG TPA: DNA translocase FtsK 4TM domain-containing protein [Bryobacteraceae bacterium]|nr:DNA translocase FtsK 4TM domain-containing protein [Bryobacteraceae bacterium]